LQRKLAVSATVTSLEVGGEEKWRGEHMAKRAEVRSFFGIKFTSSLVYKKGAKRALFLLNHKIASTNHLDMALVTALTIASSLLSQSLRDRTRLSEKSKFITVKITFPL